MALKRSELLFLYDIENNNPNGDPLDSNKPRMDEETGHNIVTDVRLKRTIRDYLMNFKGFDGTGEKDIFVKTIEDEKGFVQDGKARAKNFNDKKEEVLKKCIDIRLFGGVLPLEGDSITFTGPVQFKMGKSLNQTEVVYIKGTGAFASGKDKGNKTFREEYIVPYSLISFYGLINENSAKHTSLSQEDVKLLLEGIWEGTKILNTRSKVGQTPQLLLKINYKENNFHIGALDKLIKIKSNLEDLKIRDIQEVTLDIELLKAVISKNQSKIESIEYKLGDRVSLTSDIKTIFTHMQEIVY